MRSWVILAALLAIGSPARADDEATSSHRAVLDQVQLEPSVLTGQRLRFTMSVISLQGQVADVDASALKVTVNKTELKAPFAVGSYGATDADTAIVVVVQSSLDFADVLPVIMDSFDQAVLATASDRTQVAILTYGETIGAGKLGSVKTARGKISSVTTDNSTADPVLLDTLERALVLLKKAKTKPEGRPLRKIIVAIGDGRDLSNDRERVMRVGDRAAKDGVRIDSFAFSPKDVRRPLLALGELSKRSLGTFRWIRGPRAESWMPAFQQLAGEISQQLVVTYFLGADQDVAGKKLVVAITGRTQIEARNELKIPEASCLGQVCAAGAYCAADTCVTPRAASGRGVLGWILLIGGLVIGALVVLGAIGYVITKRQERQAAGPPAPRAPSSEPPRVPSSQPPSSISAPPASVPPPVSSQPVTGPRLYVMSGPRAGQEIALRHGFMIGKQIGCDLQIDDGYTSSQHAQIGMDHFGNCRLYDRGSTNGTYVNGVRVTEYVLEHGMTLRIGSTELRFLAQ
ncbi:MAG TPA: FHA domain-containing protein [Kofleriaceae bacterium]|nr:FHA domain-containing protein [Kofleriaceae bacterium]